MARFFAVLSFFLLAPLAAQAECLLKPDLSNHNGYWRYRVNRQTHQHCWYLSGSKARAEKAHAEKAATEKPKSEKPRVEKAKLEIARPAKAKPAKSQAEKSAPTHGAQTGERTAHDKLASADTALDPQPAPTAAYLVDEAWNVIGLEQAPVAMEAVVGQLRRAAKYASIAWSLSAPIVPVQQASLVPLVQTPVAAPPGHAWLAPVAAAWLLLTASLMWWVQSRGGPFARLAVWSKSHRRSPAIEEEDRHLPVVATDLRLLTQAVSAHFAAEDERVRAERRSERRVVMGQRRSG